MNILFVCKYNRFRSKVAEAYFNKINKNKNIKTESAGIIRGKYPLSKDQVRAAKKLCVNMRGKPQTLSIELLKKTDLIVIVADNVPEEIFAFKKKYLKKMIVWKIKDVTSASRMDQNEKIIKQIIKRIDNLVKQLEERKW